MEATRTAKVALVVVLLAFLFVEGPVQAVLDWREDGRPQVLDLFTQAPTAQNLRAFERTLEDRAWSANAVRPAMEYLRFAALEDLGAKALAGREGWLFYRPGVDYLMQPWPGTGGGGDAPDPLAAIVDFRDALARRNIALLVVIAPGKASVYPDKLSARAGVDPGGLHGPTGAFLDRLREASVPCVDLFSVYRGARAMDGVPDLYLARDTHWSPTGALLAAQAVAARVLQEGWIQPGTVAYGEVPVDVTRKGDIVHMADSSYIEASFAPETITCGQIIDPASGHPYADAPDSPVLVLGDSFLRIYQRDEPGAAGFIACLAREIRQPVASIVSDGGASTLVRQELARKPEMLRGKKLVIWEFVERDLRFGTDGWRKVDLGL